MDGRTCDESKQKSINDDWRWKPAYRLPHSTNVRPIIWILVNARAGDRARARLYLCTAIVLLCSSMSIRLGLVICMRKSVVRCRHHQRDWCDWRVRCIGFAFLLLLRFFIFFGIIRERVWSTSRRRDDVYTFVFWCNRCIATSSYSLISFRPATFFFSS